MNDDIIKAEGIELAQSDMALETPTGLTGVVLRKIPDYLTFEKTAVVPNADAADADFYPIFYVPNVRCFLIEARLRYTTASTSGTETVEKISNGISRGSGGSMLVSTFDTSAFANRTYLKGPTTVFAGIQLSPGDAVALRAGGTLTNLRNVAVTCLFGINMSNYPLGQSATTILSGI